MIAKIVQPKNITTTLTSAKMIAPAILTIIIIISTAAIIANPLSTMMALYPTLTTGTILTIIVTPTIDKLRKTVATILTSVIIGSFHTIVTPCVSVAIGQSVKTLATTITNLESVSFHTSLTKVCSVTIDNFGISATLLTLGQVVQFGAIDANLIFV
jgi:hypothetical protein